MMRIVLGVCMMVLLSGAHPVPEGQQVDGFAVVDPTVTAILFPATGPAGEPFLAKSPEGAVFASWLERRGETTVFLFSRLTDSAWSTPVTIASGSNWFVNWADVPTFTAASGGRLLATWLERLGEGRYAYGVRYAVSRDAGATWSTPAWLHTDRSETEHGFVSAVAVPEGFLVVWLDGNGYATERREMGLHSRIIGFDGKPGPEGVVDKRTCDCCPTTLANAGDGRVVTLYRGRTGEEVRDIVHATWKDGIWTRPGSVHEDDWQINACPVNGPTVHVSGGRMIASWFTAAGGAPTLNAAWGDEKGNGFQDPVRVDLGNPVGRVSARMRTSSEAAILWIEGSKSATSGLLLRTFDPSGRMSPPISISAVSESRSSGYPRLEVDGDDLIAVWTATTDPPTIQSARIAW